MRRRTVSILFSIISFLEMIIFLYLNKFTYQNSLKNIDLIFLLQLLILFITHQKLNSISQIKYKSYIIINILLIVVIPIVVALSLPKYTYNQAKVKFINEKVTDSIKFINADDYENKQYTDVQGMKTIDLTDNKYLLVDKYYLFFIDNNQSIEGYVFNSVKGTYRLLQIQAEKPDN